MFDERRPSARRPVREDGDPQVGFAELGALTAVTRNVWPTLGADSINFTPEGEPIRSAGGSMYLGLRAEGLQPEEVVVVGVVEQEEYNAMFLMRYREGGDDSPKKLLGLVLHHPEEAESVTYAVIPIVGDNRGSRIIQNAGQQVRKFFEPKDKEGEQKKGLTVNEIKFKDITVLERKPEMPRGEPMVVIKLMKQKEGAVPMLRFVV